MQTNSRGVVVFDGVATKNIGDVQVVVFQGPSTLPVLTKLFELMDQVLARHPQTGVIAVQFVMPTSTPPNSEARAVMSREFAKRKTVIRRLVTVPLGDELWVGVVRTILRASAMVSGMMGVQVVDKSFDGAFQKVREKATSATPAVDQLRAATVDCYEALGLRPDRALLT